MQRPSLLVFALASLLPFTACASGPGKLDKDVVWKGADGKTVYEIESDDRGFEVVDGQKKEVVDFRWVDGTLRIRAATKVLGFVCSNNGGLCICDADKKQVWQLRRDGADNWVLESASGVAAKLESRSDGYKVTDAAGKETARVKTDADDVTIRTPANKVLLESKLRLPTLAAACMSFDTVPVEQRLGLLVGVVGYKLD